MKLAQGERKKMRNAVVWRKGESLSFSCVRHRKMRDVVVRRRNLVARMNERLRELSQLVIEQKIVGTKKRR